MLPIQMSMGMILNWSILFPMCKVDKQVEDQKKTFNLILLPYHQNFGPRIGKG